MTQATDYFKQAASYIRKAAQAKQDEINQLRHEINDREADMHKQISSLEDAIRVTERDLATPPQHQIDPDRSRSTKVNQIAQFHGQITDVRRNFDKRRNDINIAISQLEREISDLNQQASNFENRQ